ncbi:MAG: P1 family peptidase, partial [Actinomycetota bacterium]
MSARARDLGLIVDGAPGPLNAITDVDGVQVGYGTLVEGEGDLVVGQGPVRTGVTVILPAGRDHLEEAVPAGWFSLNGNGEMTGTTWIEEYGGLTHPIAISNTHAVGDVHRGIIDWVAARSPSGSTSWMLPVVAETWDGYLNDIDGRHVSSATV